MFMELCVEVCEKIKKSVDFLCIQSGTVLA